MNPQLVARLEKALVLLIVVSFTLPGILWFVFLPSATRTPATAWLRNRTLSGAIIRREVVPRTLANVLSAKYQTATATDFDTHFIGREMMIRAIGEVYLRAFHMSTVGQLVGPHLSLIEPTYAEEYCWRRGTKEDLRPFVEDLRRMQDFCDARHIAFAVLITPSKAAIYPENLPPDWLRRYKPTPRYYDNFVLLLRENGVRCVDGHRIAAGMKPAASVPVFPLGGIHWGDPAVLTTTNALLETLAGQGLNVQPIRDYSTQVFNVPKGQDRDLADLLNTALPWRYPVETVTVQPVKTPAGTYRPNLVVVGGSFTWKMLDLLDASRQFSEMECYFYYMASKSTQFDGERHQIAKPTQPLNFDTDVFAADALVLEVNEQTLPTPAEHLTRFLQDALAVLPDPQTAKAPFHYESRMTYRWGDTLSFVADRQSMNIGATRGFATFTASGSHTVGPVASIRFTAPPPEENMVLEMTAGALIADKRLPEQRVSVYANGHAVGEWVWRSPVVARRELVIPKEFLSGGEVLLEFRIAHPMSMAELGFGRDSRKIGIEVSSVRLYGAGK